MSEIIQNIFVIALGGQGQGCGGDRDAPLISMGLRAKSDTTQPETNSPEIGTLGEALITAIDKKKEDRTVRRTPVEAIEPPDPLKPTNGAIQSGLNSPNALNVFSDTGCINNNFAAQAKESRRDLGGIGQCSRAGEVRMES